MTLPIGIHLSYWQVQWRDNLLPLIGKAKQAGYAVAEFPLLFPRELKIAELRQNLEDNGMRASCGTGLNPDTDITHPQESVRQAGLAHLHDCLQAASRLGSPVLGGVTYAPWGVFPADDRGARRKRCIQSLKMAARMAADHGVTLCLEVLNRFEGYLLNSVAQGLTLLQEVDSPHVKLHLDTFHLNIEEDQLGAAFAQAGAHIGHVHCVENNRKFPGQGHIPWAEVRQGIQAAGYQGYLVVEAFVNPAGEVGQGLFIWRPLAENLDEAAHQGALFLHGVFNDV
jgi:D-psicose/D-tagatose/L-ribulose 3-epimerase